MSLGLNGSIFVPNGQKSFKFCVSSCFLAQYGFLKKNLERNVYFRLNRKSMLIFGFSKYGFIVLDISSKFATKIFLITADISLIDNFFLSLTVWPLGGCKLPVRRPEVHFLIEKVEQYLILKGFRSGMRFREKNFFQVKRKKIRSNFKNRSKI